MSLPYDPLKQLFQQAKQELTPGGVDVTSGGSGLGASPAIAVSITDVNEAGEATSEAFWDTSKFDSEEELWA